MSKYIFFDSAVRAMACEMYADSQMQGYEVNGIEDFIPEAKAWLEDVQSIDIVRCRECKYWEDFECQCDWASTDHEGGASYSLDRDADDFCSYGERKEP